jgi:hypothetical protein
MNDYIIGFFIIIVIILVGLTIWNIVSIQKMQKDIDNSIQKQLNDIVSKGGSIDKIMHDITNLVSQFDDQKLSTNNKFNLFDDKVKLINVIKGTYSMQIVNDIKCIISIYPSKEFFGKYKDTDIIPIEYNTNKFNNNNNNTNTNTNTTTAPIISKNMTISELKNKLNISYNQTNDYDPIIIVFTIIQNNNNTDNNNRILQVYALINKDTDIFKFINNEKNNITSIFLGKNTTKDNVNF